MFSDRRLCLSASVCQRHIFYTQNNTMAQIWKKYAMTLFSQIITYSLKLFRLTQCDTSACLDAHKADILEGIDSEKQAYISFKGQSLHNEWNGTWKWNWITIHSTPQHTSGPLHSGWKNCCRLARDFPERSRSVWVLLSSVLCCCHVHCPQWPPCGCFVFVPFPKYWAPNNSQF